MTPRKQAKPAESPVAQWDSETQMPPPASKSLSLPAAIAAARRAMPGISAQAVDSIVSAEHHDGGWRIVADVIESRARIGDNDLLSAYELELDAQGELTGFRRIRRYNREDRA